MRTACYAILMAMMLTGCQVSKKTDQTSPAAKKEAKSTAEKAGDAAARARKKAEALKAEQDRKAKETDAAGNQ